MPQHCIQYSYSHVDMTESYCRSSVNRYFDMMGIFYRMHNLNFVSPYVNCDEKLEDLVEKIKPLMELHKNTIVFNGDEGKNICQTRLNHVGAFISAFQKAHEKQIDRLPKCTQRRIGWI